MYEEKQYLDYHNESLRSTNQTSKTPPLEACFLPNPLLPATPLFSKNKAKTLKTFAGASAMYLMHPHVHSNYVTAEVQLR